MEELDCTIHAPESDDFRRNVHSVNDCSTNGAQVLMEDLSWEGSHFFIVNVVLVKSHPCFYCEETMVVQHPCLSCYLCPQIPIAFEQNPSVWNLIGLIRVIG